MIPFLEELPLDDVDDDDGIEALADGSGFLFSFCRGCCLTTDTEESAAAVFVALDLDVVDVVVVEVLVAGTVTVVEVDTETMIRS